MKKLFVALPLALFGTTQAAATQGMTCRTSGAPRIEMSVLFGAASAVLRPRLTVGGRNVPVVMAQSWLDDPEFRFDLTDPQARQRELRIKARRNGNVFDGSAWRDGKRHWVRCRET
jgi:hypothetical protein